MDLERATRKVITLDLPKSQVWLDLLEMKLTLCEERLASDDYRDRCRETSMTAYMIRLLKELKVGTLVTISELECVLKREQPLFDQQNFDSAAVVIQRWTSRDWLERELKKLQDSKPTSN